MTTEAKIDPRTCRSLSATWLVLALSLFLAGPGGAEESGSPPIPTPAEVEAELGAVCAEIHAGLDSYYGRGQIERAKAFLRQPGVDAANRVAAQKSLAANLLRLGQAEQAVGLYNQTLALAGESGLPKAEAIEILASLGVAALRVGETANCVDMHGPAMCILPIGPGGRHRDTRGSELALKAFGAVLRGAPDYPNVAWLTNVAAMTLGRWPDAVPPAHRVPVERMTSPEGSVIPRFTDVAHAVGLRIMDVAGGGIVDDFDGDGFLDVVTSSAEPCAGMRLFLNRAGREGRAEATGTLFEERSEASGLAAQLGALNVVHADYDDDGDLDLYALRGGWLGETGKIRNSLLRNRGDGTFEDVTARSGLGGGEPQPTQTAAWADYDLDGDLDLYVGIEGLSMDSGGRARLFRNRGDGTFEEVATEAGVENRRYAKSVAWGDVDDDGDPDLYVSNLGPNRLYLNRGDGTFVDRAEELGVTEPAVRSFGAFFLDLENDGDLDLFVTSYLAGPPHVEAWFLDGESSPELRPRVYRNLGTGDDGLPRFREVSAEMGLEQPSAPMGHNVGDLDNDGFPDVYLGTGWPQYEALMPNLMYRNVGGERFVDVTYAGGFGHLQKGHGVAFADLDHDGDQDVFEQMGGAYPGDAYHSVLYENPMAQRPRDGGEDANAWITLVLEGVGAPRTPIGARIRVVVATPEGERDVHHLYGAGGSFGGNSLRAEIGLGDAESIRRVEIRWPGRADPQVLEGLEMRRFYRVRQGDEAKVLELVEYELTP